MLKKIKKSPKILLAIALLILLLSGIFYYQTYHKTTKIKPHIALNLQKPPPVFQIKEAQNEITSSDLNKDLELDNLKQEIKEIRNELAAVKIQNNIVPIILSIIELKEQAFSLDNFKEQLKNTKLLCAQDQNLSENLSNLDIYAKNGIANLTTITQSLNNLTLTHQVKAKSQNWLDEIKYQIARAIRIRNIKTQQNLPQYLTQAHKLLEQNRAAEALAVIKKIDAKYQTAEIIKNLENYIEVKLTFEDIFDYLSQISNQDTSNQ